ncbi:hypothetical protein [Halarcobacter sp.]|uniref:hypothetical protein n=1 Tax=Halarcobacter sp. TaxID=2321133 RepID=UPI002AA6F12D|nr:hypothetical protein [Halarcobacter sp.]
MKKLFFGLTLFIIIIIGAIYGLLFTSPGNSYVASIIETKVNEGQQDVNMKVNDFKLTMSDILFKATLDENSVINIEGKLNIFAKSVDLKYDINVKDLSKLQNITKQKLNGSFSTKGTIVGNQELTTIEGNSLVASSNTSYKVKLVDFKPDNILFKMKNAKMQELLHLVNQPIYAKGLLNIDANINNANIPTLDGLVNTSITNGVLNAKAINKELKEDKLPIIFEAKTTTNLIPNNANTKLDFDSSIAKLNIKDANVNLNTMVVNSDYDLFVKNLSKLEALINQKFNGSFSTKGNVVIEDKNITLKGDSDIFGSETIYDIKVENSKPKSANVLISNAKIESILNLVNQPKYAAGILDIVAKVDDANMENLAGTITTKISNCIVNNTIINKQFNQKLKDKLNFKADITTNLEDTKAISLVNVDTSMAKLDMKKAVFDVKDVSFISDYSLLASDLSKLYDVTQQKMRGSLKVDGNIKQENQNLSIDGVSSLFGGDIKFNLLNDDFKANIKDVEVKQLTHMLYYPEIFQSKSNIDVDYNLASKVGKISGNLLNGKFIKNEYSTIINTFAKFDITREIYEKVDLKSDINDNIINSVVDMKSKNTSIVVPSSTINTKNNTVIALIQSKIKDYSFDTTVKGNLSNPKVSVDTKAFLKSAAGKKIKEKYKEKLEKKIQEKLGDKINLDKLFNKNESKPKIKKSVKTVKVDKVATDQEIAKAFKEMFGQN